MDKQLFRMVAAGVVSGLIILSIQRTMQAPTNRPFRASEGIWV